LVFNPLFSKTGFKLQFGGVGKSSNFEDGSLIVKDIVLEAMCGNQLDSTVFNCHKSNLDLAVLYCSTKQNT
jgi:hypothetical protein